MRDEHNTEIDEFEFLYKPEGREIFGKLDYLLKDGVHIQNREGQFHYFAFIRENETSLANYYYRFFGVALDKGGENNEIYYFLNFIDFNRGQIDQDHRYFLKAEFVIIGLLMYKIIFIDKNIELTSVKKLQDTIKRDYEDLKPGIYRLLAKTRKGVISPTGDERIDALVEEALREFRALGWVELNGDYFDVLPAFQRLINIYGDLISNIDHWIEQFKSE